ncbi:hypothetical protein [uncultured Roseibium sp.]|uniref:hypothetical protein n=1 Tax=uncultured Roseibium sp. TaxID=1936171 RepID=UPI002597994E|nr:hypothetical protein [uncultured Roseibium sp.]
MRGERNAKIGRFRTALWGSGNQRERSGSDYQDFTAISIQDIVPLQGVGACATSPSLAGIYAHRPTNSGKNGRNYGEHLMNRVAQRQYTSTDVCSASGSDAELIKLLDAKSSDPDFWSSKERDRRDSAHCIFQYPAMMVPIVQRRLMGTVLEACPDIQSVYDPFMGSGTSLVSGMHFGLNLHGNDVNPLAVLISRVRTAQSVEPSVDSIAEQVVASSKEDRRRAIETSMHNREKWFEQHVAIELSRLRRAIRNCDDLWVRRFLWVTLAETVRLTSNDRTSTYKLHARPTDEIRNRKHGPIDVFRGLAQDNAASFSAFRQKLSDAGWVKSGKYIGQSDIRVGDTSQAADFRGDPQSFDLLMTSPPYGDNLTTVPYGQHSYLPLQWIDFQDIDATADTEMLRTTQEIDRRSLGGSSSDRAWDVPKLLEASPRLKQFAEGLPSRPADGRTRLLRFYRDFGASLDRIVSVMKPGGYMVWTVGNRSIAGQQVPTDLVLGELLEGLNSKLITTLTRRIHYKRMPDRNASSATMREEKILVVRTGET